MPISFPLIKNFHAINIRRAFFINSLVVAIIAALTIEIRLTLKKEKYKNNNRFLQNISDFEIILLVIVISFLISIIVYLLFYGLIGFGGGLIASQKPAPWS